jgi:hypothetical protein
VLHPEEAWPRRWVQRKWVLVAVALALVLAGAATAIALAMSGRGGNPGPAAAPEPPAVSAPESLVAEREGLLGVRLTWAAPTDGVKVEHYDVYRNGSKIISLSDVGTTYVDDGVRPGKDYTYEIVARGTADGRELTSGRVSVAYSAPVPPLEKARVAGDFTVKVKTLSQSGFEEYAPRTYGWQLDPKCGSGACDVAWRDLQEKRIRTLLKKSGPRYRGTYSGFFFGFCSGTRGTSTVQIELKVEGAKAIDGQWMATRLVGRLDQTSPPQLGCVSSRASEAVTAKLVR